MDHIWGYFRLKDLRELHYVPQETGGKVRTTSTLSTMRRLRII